MRGRMILHGAAIALATAATLIAPQAIWAAPTPTQKCEGGMDDASGKYWACVAKAEKSFVLTGDLVAYGAAADKCQDKLVSSWEKLETMLFASTFCPSFGEQAPIQSFVDACIASLAEALAGSPLPLDVAACNDDLPACNGDLGDCQDDLASTESDVSTCEGSATDCSNRVLEPFPQTAQILCYNDAGTAIACAGTGQNGDTLAGAPRRFRDNGNGTITDQVTGLMWEKQSDNGSIHDKDNLYAGVTAAIGKATTLNGMAFAGHTDWRVPNIRELESLVHNGRVNPAIDLIFHTGCTPGCAGVTCSCTKNSIHHSSTNYHPDPTRYFEVNFDDGDVYEQLRTSNYHVRAVRTAN